MGVPQRGPDLRTTRPSPLRRALDWLLEDPSKTRPAEKSERERAIEAIEEQDAARRPARSLKERLLGAVFTSGEVLPVAPPDPPRRKERSEVRVKAAKGGRQHPKTPNRVARLWHKVLGETHRPGADGEAVLVPPAETDWRWNLHRFFRSNVRAVAYLRVMLVVVLVASTAWTSVFATTGYNLFDVLAAPDPDDPRTQHRLPFFIIESGSMMHPDAPYGRLGTIDPGDLVVIEKVDGPEDIVTYYGRGETRKAGAHGDVIIFLPITPNVDNPPPVIHRAMAYLELTSVPIVNPLAGQAGQAPIVNVPRYTVEEFGIVNAPSVTIPELGLYNYAPRMSGYITQGDNPNSNTWADQALGVTPNPVPLDRIIGKLRYEVPFVGLAKIALAGQDPNLVSPDTGWCTFLAGQAACDTWEVFFVIVVLVVGVPLALAIYVYGRRAWQRHVDRRELQRRQDEDARVLAAARAGSAEDPAPALPIHDATDLLTGRVRIEAGPRGGERADWSSLVAPARVRFVDE